MEKKLFDAISLEWPGTIDKGADNFSKYTPGNYPGQSGSESNFPGFSFPKP